MNYKKLFWILVMSLILALVAPQIVHAAGLTQEAPPYELPQEFVLGVVIVAGLLVNKGIELFLLYFKIDLSERASMFTQALVTLLLTFFSGVFGAVPPVFQGLTTQVLVLIGLLLATLGVKLMLLDAAATRLGYPKYRTLWGTRDQPLRKPSIAQ
jgi:hypothetical protein